MAEMINGRVKEAKLILLFAMRHLIHQTRNSCRFVLDMSMMMIPVRIW